MSVPTPRQAFAFLAPLRGRTSVFITPSRRRSINLGRFLLGCLAASRKHVVIFDTSSLYGTNIHRITEGLPKEFLQQSSLITPPSQHIEEALANLFTMKTRAILIDDLNSLHHLISSDKHGSGTQRLFSLLRLLSYQARVTDLCVFWTLYRAEGDSSPEKATRRSLAAAADLEISTKVHSNRITFACNEATGWPNNQFSAPLYF